MKDRNERLRDLLREGDPAAGDPGLSPEEVQGMRRTVLSAVPEPRRRGWLVPVLATAAALILAAVLVLWRTAPGTPPEPGPVMAAPVTPAPVPEPIRPAPAPQLEPEAPVRIVEKKPEERPEPPAAAPAEQQAVLPATPEGQRQIQFSTPGGTRVIWMLNPATE